MSEEFKYMFGYPYDVYDLGHMLTVYVGVPEGHCAYRMPRIEGATPHFAGIRAGKGDYWWFGYMLDSTDATGVVEEMAAWLHRVGAAMRSMEEVACVCRFE